MEYLQGCRLRREEDSMYKNENPLLKRKGAKYEPHTVQVRAALITDDNDTLIGDSDYEWKHIANVASSSRKTRK